MSEPRILETLTRQSATIAPRSDLNGGARRPRRVLILRTSRFVGVAVTYARTRWPDAELRVLYQIGAEADLDAAGVSVDSRMAMPAGGLTPTKLLTSPWGRRLLRWRPDVVLLQWWNPDGHGHEQADRAALLLQRRGFHALCEDGTCARVTIPGRMWRCIRGVALVLTVAVASLLLWPASVWFDARARRRMRTTE